MAQEEPLKLLVTKLLNKEIETALLIASETEKKHTRNIYQN